MRGMMRRSRIWMLGALATAMLVPLLTPTPAKAWWDRGYGWHGYGWRGYGWRPGVVIGVPPVIVAPPVVYAAPVAPRRVWIPAHWNGPYWVGGHWGY